jgi:thiol-disulfide isomerase/thioredoxin
VTLFSRARPKAGRVRPALVGLVLAVLATNARAQPSGQLKALDGASLDEAQLSRGAVILVAWASWSPRCRDIVPRVNALVERWGGRARVVTINFQEERSAVEEFLTGKQLDAPVYLDVEGAFSKKHSITFLPGLQILREGVTVFNGRLGRDPDAVIAQTLE